jgi:pimeloyl-ACP methyl ester carboxylesterase
MLDPSAGASGASVGRPTPAAEVNADCGLEGLRPHATTGRTTMNSFTSFDGARIAYHDEGDGPPVILLHGFAVNGLGQYGHIDRLRPAFEAAKAWLREMLGAEPPTPDLPAEGRPGLIARLREAGARVLAPDLRGFGASDKSHDPAAYAHSALARDVLALADHLGLDAVDVLGFSMGAVTAAKLLALGAPRVKSAILAGVAQYILEGEVMELPENFPMGDVPRLTLRAHSEAVANSLACDETVPGNPGSAYLKLMRALGNDPKALAAVLRGDGVEQVSPEALHKVQIPVLVLNGREDVANQAVGRLVEVFPNGRSAACDGDHHTTPWCPSFQQAVVDFFEAQWRSRGVSFPCRGARVEGYEVRRATGCS